MITIRRDEDDEILGYLAPAGENWQPLTVFHVALAEPTSQDEAEDIVRSEGLASLSEPWWVEDDQGQWSEARLQEAQPYRIRIRWTDPMLDQPAHGEWIDTRERRVRR
jgi:hypothetical protein